MPGAYLKTNVEKTASIALMIDGNANKGCPPAAMPVVDYSVDHSPWQTKQLTITDSIYPLVLAEQLDLAKQHHLEFYFRSASLGPNRWGGSEVHLRISGIRLDAGGSVVAVSSARTRRSVSAIRSLKGSVLKGSVLITRIF